MGFGAGFGVGWQRFAVAVPAVGGLGETFVLVAVKRG